MVEVMRGAKGVEHGVKGWHMASILRPTPFAPKPIHPYSNLSSPVTVRLKPILWEWREPRNIAQ